MSAYVGGHIVTSEAQTMAEAMEAKRSGRAAACKTTMVTGQIRKTRRIKRFRANRDVLGETDVRHCHREGTRQMGVHDLSPFGLGPGGRIAAYRSEFARTGPRRPWGRPELF